MSALAGVATVAVLFVVFGLLRWRDGADCAGGSCATCAGTCHRRPAPDEVPDVR